MVIKIEDSVQGTVASVPSALELLSDAELKSRQEARVYPTVTKELIEGKIRDVSFLRNEHHTICIITMDNGFTFIGHSAPADVRNFDIAMGERYSYDQAFKQIWTHEGYLLRQRLFDQELQDQAFGKTPFVLEK
jgi:hypothetical protein